MFGAGSAGAVVANRLSKKYRVLLLEAGGEPNPLQYIPGFGVFFVNYPETDWMHKTVPQKYASLNSVNQQSSWSAGRGLGGTGTLNLMIYLRGHKKDFDNWGRITGDPSWSWEGVLPYFKSYEDYEEDGDPRYHGFGGDLRVEQPDYIGMGPEFVRAGQELGYSHCDLNAPFTEGFDIIKFPIKDGIRQGTYKAFLEPIRRLRAKLVIRKYAHVNRVLFKHGNIAFGLEYDRHGVTRQAFASKEVIISAGTVNSAKLLMLSGIGPRAHLQEQGIPVYADLPVGQNLQDHIGAYMGPFFIDKPRAVALERDLTPSAFVQWFLGGKGILSTTGLHATGIISSSLAKARGEGDWPDIQYFLYGFSVFKTFGAAFARGFGLTADEQNKFYEHAIDKESFLVAVSGARPFSRGFVKLGGKSPYDKPVIDPRYFTDPGDQDLYSMVEGIKTLLYLTQNTTALGHELGTRYTTQPLPGCEHLRFQSDEYWECYARRYTVTLHHPVGTASMGSVVDTQLRVYGTQGLRVIDSSVAPVLVVTNTQASAIMIGEKGSDMVLKYWEEQKKKQSQYGAPQPQQYGPLEPSQSNGVPTVPDSTQQYGVPDSSSYSASSWLQPATTYSIASLNSTKSGYSVPGYYSYNTVK
ncbi:Glucose dehydrogenase [FAD, quinone] [Orchesella cincta]|uniref:Glucose dehydrogenase [FAD, quinone] n=1 Tax=Orchesella cincta TaxID=48709 RepID=A0A1D2MBM8_ORCCI|nr:Glucose dehydrogenase [FAD, quinone] [Orchesella cincta]